MEIESKNACLAELAHWAQEKARQFVVSGTELGSVNLGDGGKWYGPSRRFSNRSHVIRQPKKYWAQPKPYIPSYWAGYYDRTAFYIRDFVHQAPGAEYLGYHEENYRMMQSFINGACEETQWYAPWSINFDGSIYYMDTPNPRRFVRELTGQYELVETLCKLYFLSGDSRYIHHRMLAFAERILGEFTQCRDGVVFVEKNGVPEGRGSIWRGSASYNESGTALAESGDCIAALYQALRAYSRLAESLGEWAKATSYFKRSEMLRTYFNDTWSIPPEGSSYVFGIDRKGKKYWRWVKSVKGITGAETCFFIPMKLLSQPGARNDRLLDEIDQRAGDPKTAQDNIESYTYLPQVFYPYHQAERAWRWMQYIGDRRALPHIHEGQGKNEDYPELSFTMISSIVEGLLGLSANVPAGEVATCPCLPQEITDLSVKSLQVGTDRLDIEYLSHQDVVFTNHSLRPLRWKCAFPGTFIRFLIDGRDVAPRSETVNGIERFYVEVVVPPDSSAAIRAVQ